MVGDPRHQACGRSILDGHRHLFRLAERERFGHHAFDRISGTARQQGKIARGDDAQSRVENDRDEAEHRRDDRQRDQARAYRRRPDEPGLGREASDEAQRGGTTRLATASSTLSGVWPATSASGRRIKRWRNAEARSAFTLSGVTNSLPSNAASTRAASISRTSALVLAPSAISGAARVADARSTM